MMLLRLLLLLWCCCPDQEPLPPILQGRPFTDWVQDLQDKDPQKRLPAIALMGAMGEQARGQVPRLRELLREGDTATSLAVLNALSLIGGEEAVATLLTARLGQDRLVLLAREAALRRLFPTVKDQVTHLLHLRLHGNPAFSQAALDGLQRPGSWRKAAIPVLIEFLTSEDDRLRREACDTLASFGGEAREALPALLGLLGQGRNEYDILVALGRIRERPHQCVPVLTRYFSDARKPLQDRIAAVQAVRKFGPMAATALPALERLFVATPVPLQLAGAEAYLQVGGPPGFAVPKLAALLQTPDRSHRLQVVRLLTELGPRARAAESALQQTAEKDRDALVRSAALKALAGLRTPRPGTGAR